MTGMEVGLISVALILILIYSGMYVPIALGLVSFFSVWYLRGSVEPSIYVLTLGATTGLEDYIYGVIPLFVLMGMFVSQCDLGKDIYEVANFTLRKVKGGLGVATVAYAPFTFFNILSPLISVAMAFLGVRMLKAPVPQHRFDAESASSVDP